MLNDYPAAERKYWLQLKERGKNGLVRQEMLGNLLLWFVFTAVVAFTTRPLSRRSILLPCLAMLPIFLLEGYLRAGWRWKDFEKKCPEYS